MSNILVQQLSQFTSVSSEEALAIEASFPIRQYNKNDFLLSEGQIAKDAYLLIEGCVRKYALNDGEELTTEFYIEGDSVADHYSLANQIPSNHFYVCVENSTVAVVNADKETALYKKIPRFEAICRVEFEKMMAATMEEKASFAQKDPEAKYLHLLHEKPTLLNRVPEYQIASYLGIKPETLSRIRKRITLKQLFV